MRRLERYLEIEGSLWKRLMEAEGSSLRFSQLYLRASEIAEHYTTARGRWG